MQTQTKREAAAAIVRDMADVERARAAYDAACSAKAASYAAFLDLRAQEIASGTVPDATVEAMIDDWKMARAQVKAHESLRRAESLHEARARAALDLIDNETVLTERVYRVAVSETPEEPTDG